jgi:hypothetical protein
VAEVAVLIESVSTKVFDENADAFTPRKKEHLEVPVWPTASSSNRADAPTLTCNTMLRICEMTDPATFEERLAGGNCDQRNTGWGEMSPREQLKSCVKTSENKAPETPLIVDVRLTHLRDKESIAVS